MYETKGYKENRGKIGIFDSGFGGLSILKDIVKKMPEYNYVYLGDTARAPYGSRSHEVILEFTKQGIDFLFREGADIIVLACNTASALALRSIQQEYLPKKYPGKKVLGVIIPTAEFAITCSPKKYIGVLATEATVGAGAFKRELTKLDREVEVFEVGAPLLVPLIEAGEEQSLFTKEVIQKYLLEVCKKPIDTLILGCTHYGIIESLIKKLSKNIKVVGEAQIVADKLFQYFEKHPEIRKNLSKDAGLTFFTTDTKKKFDTIGSRFFGKSIASHEIHL